MATEAELLAAQTDAQLALLKAIEKNANSAGSNAALRLAEAYAWLQAPRQSHSGGGTSS